MILNMTAGGSTGCVLTVTAPTGAVVTASRDGKTLTKTAASGTAVFRGLESGEWVLTMTDGEQTSQPQIVTVTNDYAAELTFFAATIHVTYPAGSVCTASDGVTTLTAPDKTGTWDCTVRKPGTWTLHCTDGEDSYWEDAAVSVNGETKSAELSWYLFHYGNSPYTWTAKGLWYKSGYGEPTAPGTAAQSDGSVQIYLNRPSGAWHSGMYAASVDVTHYKTLKFLAREIDVVEVQFMVIKSDASNMEDGRISRVAVGSDTAAAKVYEVDVSSVTGTVYVCVWLAANGWDTGGTVPSVVKATLMSVEAVK